MSRNITKQGYFMHHLTKVTLLENIDGIHVKEKTLGYVAEEPFCVLCELLCKYYVCKYNSLEVFVPGFFPGNYMLGIYDVGSLYLVDNFTKNIYHDLTTFLEIEHSLDFELEKALVESDSSPVTKKYIEFLKISFDEEKIMKLAFDYQDIIQNITQGDETNEEYNKRIHSYFTNKNIGDMTTDEFNYYVLVQQYIFKREAEQITAN